MASLLRLAALVNVLWAALLFAAPAPFQTGALAETLAHLLAAHLAALAGLYLWAARRPHEHIAIVVAAIAVTAARVILDLVGLLGELPAEPAVYFVVDLLIGFALLVGLLEALPRTLSRRRDDPAAGDQHPSRR